MRRGNPDAPFLATARGARAARRPLWIMRQAGRYLPEYRAVRESMSFLELCNTPAAAAEVTLQPLQRFDLDAAILFTDLMTPVEPMGLGLRYDPGPVLDTKIETRDQVDAIEVPDPGRDLSAMLETARLVRAKLSEDKALIGFVGAPFTVACYLTEGRGSKSWDLTRRLLHGEPEMFDALLARLTECLEPLVAALVDAGCDAIQVFDSWAGVLSTDEYIARCARHTDRLLGVARESGAVALDFVNGAAQHIERMHEAPADVLAVDWRMPIGRLRASTDKVLQGNLDPTALFCPPDELRARVRAICEGAGSRHVFNLGHGILPQTDPAALEVVVDEVHRS